MVAWRLQPASVLALALCFNQAGRALGILKEAISHVQCEVCQMAVAKAHSYAEENNIGEEDALNDMVEGLCSAGKKEGRWVTRLDIKREDEDAQLTLEEQGTMGWCRTECRTVQKACEASLKKVEGQLVTQLQKKRPVKDLKKLCKKSCAKDIPKLGKKWKDELFEGRDEKEVETMDMMADMKQKTGMGMKMYKREDLTSMSEGDMEIMAAREQFAQERMAAKMENEEM